MSTLTKAGVMGLSITERIQLVSDIWDTVIEEPEKVTLTEEQKSEIDYKLDEYYKNQIKGHRGKQFANGYEVDEKMS